MRGRMLRPEIDGEFAVVAVPLAGLGLGILSASCERAGLEGVSPHTLRHTAATWLMQAGTDVWQASGFLS